MSRYFSITIITSVMRIFSAATSSISPIVMIVTIRSIFSAPSSCLLRSIQVVVVKRSPATFSTSLAIFAASIQIVHVQFDLVDLVHGERLLRRAEATVNAQLSSIS